MSRILVVDDNRQTREVFKEYFEGKGHTVILAEDGGDGYRAALKRKPDFIVTDVLMPGKTGIEMTEGLRAKGWAGPIIVCSSSGEKSVRWAAKEAGATSFVLKDSNPAVTAAAVERRLKENGLEPSRC
jgi:two-component system phosphate regulon response regulator OmpR